jgi:hypothetical protein
MAPARSQHFATPLRRPGSADAWRTRPQRRKARPRELRIQRRQQDDISYVGPLVASMQAHSVLRRAGRFWLTHHDEPQYRGLIAGAGSAVGAEAGVGNGSEAQVMGSAGPCLMVFIPICDRALLTPGRAARWLV